MSRTWFITGASRGFGRHWAEAALDRGDRVAATARDVSTLEPLVAAHGDRVLPLQLDVTDRAAGQAAVVGTAEHFGRLDVVVNNAGYGHFGMVEELTEPELRAQLETNFFGAVWTTQAALPIMRAQGSGHLVQVTSEGGVTAFPGIGAYHASKWALEGLTQSLAGELGGSGVAVTLVEPGPYGTDWLAVGSRRSAPVPAYDGVREATGAFFAGVPFGDPHATRAAMLAVVDAEQPPLRVLFGTAPTVLLPQILRQRLDTWEQWKELSVEANG